MRLIILLIALCYIKYGDAASGKATYYGGNENGNACGYIKVNKDTFPYGYYAAIGGSNFDDGYGCGKCYKIKCEGPYGTNPSCHCSDSPEVVVQALDQCPECSDSHFDLNPTAMAKIVGPGLSGTCGVIQISYERVDCQMAGNFKVRNKGGTSQFWYGLHLDDVTGAGGIKTVELYKNNNKVGYCNKNQGPSFWICTASSGSFPDTPLSIKIISDQGTSVTAADCIKNYNGGAEFQCNTNLGGGASPNPSPTEPPVNKPTTPPPSQGNSPTTPPPSSSGGGNSKIKISNKNGLNQWWYAVTLKNIPSAGITWIKMKASNGNAWEKGTSEWDYYKFTNNAPYQPPFSFQIKANGQTIETSDVIKTLNEGDSGYMSQSFSDSFVEGDATEDTMSWTVIFAIVFIAILCIGAAVVAGYCFIKKKKEKGTVSFEDKDTGDTPIGDTKDGKDETAGYDMSPINTGRDDEEQQEIEVDVEMTEKPTPAGNV